MDASYKEYRDHVRPRVKDKYKILGFISSGTYGRVYKAMPKGASDMTNKDRQQPLYAIKKFKADAQQNTSHSAFSQSAIREILLCRELGHEHVVGLKETMVEPFERSIYMVFDYAEHDLLQILHYHSHAVKRPIPEQTIKSIMWQVLNGLSYLHSNWVLHRDLKPANILVTNKGVVKIADLGLARLFHRPLYSLYQGDKVVVTIWYRAPELLLGARHYTKSIDMWAVGCIFAELLTLRPLFKGEEIKPTETSKTAQQPTTNKANSSTVAGKPPTAATGRKTIPFQRHQMAKILEVLGTPDEKQWPSLSLLPDAPQLKTFRSYPHNHLRKCLTTPKPSSSSSSSSSHTHTPPLTITTTSEAGYRLLTDMLAYDPNGRIDAGAALTHPYFSSEERLRPLANCFISSRGDAPFDYPKRRVTIETPKDPATSTTIAHPPRASLPDAKKRSHSSLTTGSGNPPSRARPRHP